jgi:opacity protein-like surface antigen
MKFMNRHTKTHPNNLILPLAAVAMLALAGPAFAQSSGASSDTAGAVVSVQGGGFTSVVNLNDADTADFKTGFNAGGVLGLQFNRNVGLRATYTFARSETRGTGLPSAISAGTKMDRHFYGGELQFRAPLASGIAPYLLVGGGAVTMKPDTIVAQESFTKPAGKAGIGIAFDLPASSVSLFVEGSGWFYQFDQFGFDKTQFDLLWSAGLSYRFGR